MTTHTSQIALVAQNPTQHYNWIAAFSAALDAVGVSKTTDTGQVNLSGTTVALPDNLNTQSVGGYFGSVPAYQIRKLTRSGFPDIYLKFQFGVKVNVGVATTNDPNAPSYPAITCMVGSGTDGAGNLTSYTPAAPLGTFSSLIDTAFAGSTVLNAGVPSKLPQNCDFASDGSNYLSIVMGEQAPVVENYSLFVFTLERSINQGTGAYDTDGICAFAGSTSYGYGSNFGGNSWYYCDITNQVEFVSGVNNPQLPAITPPFSIDVPGSTIYLFPLVGSTMVPKGTPISAVAHYRRAFRNPVAFKFTQYGILRNYKACPRTITYADASGTMAFAVRFE